MNNIYHLIICETLNSVEYLKCICNPSWLIDYSLIVLIITNLNGLGHLPEFAEQLLNGKRGSCQNFQFDLLGKFWLMAQPIQISDNQYENSLLYCPTHGWHLLMYNSSKLHSTLRMDMISLHCVFNVSRNLSQIEIKFIDFHHEVSA